jgi:hypothetical protein
LIFPAVRAHNKAPTKVGVTVLRAPFEQGRAYDFNKLGDVVSSETVPMLAENAVDWSPPKAIQVDVTRAVRLMVAGDLKFHGFGLRVVPDRGVDDGWTVRVQLPKQPKFILEVDVYSDASDKAPGK